MNKIICPIDFSESSINALEYAAKIGEKFNSHLKLLYIFTEDEFIKVLEEQEHLENIDRLLEFANEKLESLSSEVFKISQPNGLGSCSYEILQGDLIKEIHAFSEIDRTNVIVMGTNGVSSTTEKFVGSNTVHMVQRSQCPVFCVPLKASYNNIKRIIYATDYQNEDKIALQKLVAFGMGFNASIQVLHISHHKKPTDLKDFIRFKEEILSFVNYSNLHFEMRVYEESVESEIDEFVTKEKGDLLVLMTRNKNFFEQVFKKSITKELSYFTDYPLMIFKF